MSANSDRENFKLVTEMSCLEARDYFFQPEQYTSINLPDYFNFKEILEYSKEVLEKGGDLGSVFDYKSNRPQRCDGVNYTIFTNKSGEFSWRPIQLINPILYVNLVNIITEEKAWSIIIKLFKESKETDIKCMSIPHRSLSEESNLASQVSSWWEDVEQVSIQNALVFDYLYKSDIANFYPSIYTHCFEWALHSEGRLGVKKERDERLTRSEGSKLGGKIDKGLRYMSRDQTVGIPQGSTLMDFFAEIIMAAVDIELRNSLYKNERVKDSIFQIIRYRDDYRIFCNEKEVGHEILKVLNNTLLHWKLQMNASKTSGSDDVIIDSIKQEKLDDIFEAPRKLSLQKTALRILMLSKKYPNSGIVVKQLLVFYDRIAKTDKEKNVVGLKKEINDIDTIVSIMTMVAFYSPRYISQAVGVVSLFLMYGVDDENKKNNLIEQIIRKFDKFPSTEYLELWLQKLCLDGGQTIELFNCEISKVVLRGVAKGLWNFDWAQEQVRDKMEGAIVSVLPQHIKEGKHVPIITRKEIELFKKY